MQRQVRNMLNARIETIEPKLRRTGADWQRRRLGMPEYLALMRRFQAPEQQCQQRVDPRG
jgi:hypothetical protein